MQKRFFFFFLIDLLHDKRRFFFFCCVSYYMYNGCLKMMSFFFFLLQLSLSLRKCHLAEWQLWELLQRGSRALKMTGGFRQPMYMLVLPNKKADNTRAS